MRIIFQFLLFSLVLIPFYTIANLPPTNTYIPFLSVDDRIIQLLEKSKSGTANKKLLSENVDLLFKTSNPAEQYILYIIQANLFMGINKHSNIINSLDNIDALKDQMNPEQLDTLPFINVYKKRAESYAFMGQFKKAYEAKQRFIKKYNAFILYEKGKYIVELETKYETKKKRYINELLNNQTTLKELEINETLSDEVIQKRNLYILSVVGVLFIFLLFRSWVINRSTRNLSKQDALTRLYNSQTLFTEGQQTIQRCVSNKENLCLLALHIDDFKTINHQYGDYIGDEILKKLALIGLESMRTRDMFSRLEDATFIAVLPQSSIGEVKAIAQRLKDKFTSTSFSYVGISTPIKLSFGIVEMNESCQSFEALLNAGIDVLYDLREGEGNRISIYQHD